MATAATTATAVETETEAATATPTKRSRHVPQAVRAEVFARDGEQCTFVSDAGERCSARAFLELDHVDPHGRGGSSDAANLRVRCEPHNRLYAEQCYGRAHIERQIYLRREKYGARELG